MSNVVERKGKRYGKLKVLSRAGSNQKGQALWVCLCDCGTKKTLSSQRLASGLKSCGCGRGDSGSTRRVHLEGQTMGQLLIHSYLGDGRYLCRCQCGTSVYKKTQPLTENKTSLHCGSDICSADKDFVGPILSLAMARHYGLKKYSPGKKCSKGHFSSFFVSTMGCEICHEENHLKWLEKNPKKQAQYQKKQRDGDGYKQKRNTRLKQLRNENPIFRIRELVRSRISRKLRQIKVKKNFTFDRNEPLEKAIYICMKRQGLNCQKLSSGLYELDHIIPLCEWPWSQSRTANKIVDATANNAENFQFLTSSQHQEKTKCDYKKYGWKGKEIYRDHSQTLLRDIRLQRPLPDIFDGYEKIIEQELSASLIFPNDTNDKNDS